MGLFSKLMFWKRDADLPDIDKDLGKLGAGIGSEAGTGLGQMPGAGPGAGMPEFGKTPQGQQQFNYPNSPELVPPEQSPFPRPSSAMPHAAPSGEHGYIIAKDIEVLSSKLDALRAGIESINQRLANLERIAGASEEQQRKYRW